jgi:hypothetical protein
MKQRTWFKVFFYAAVVTALTFSGCNQAATPEGEEGATEQPTAENSGGESGGGITSWFGSSEPEPEPRSVTLEAGTPIQIRTTNALSTKDVTAGQGFVGSLEEPIVQGDWVVTPKGATVQDVVANADKGVAALSIRVTQIETADGQTIDVNTSAYGVQAKSTKKKDAVKVGIASGIGAGAGGGVVLATRGDPAVISGESVVTVTLQEAVTITEAL